MSKRNSLLVKPRTKNLFDTRGFNPTRLSKVQHKTKKLRDITILAFPILYDDTWRLYIGYSQNPELPNYPQAMLNVALPVFEVISVVLAIFPVPSHWRAKNISMLMLVFWLILGNINNFINRIIWIKDADNKAPGWCDICKSNGARNVLISSC